MAITIDWDKYEVALLIEAFWKIKNGENSRSLILSELSKNLRLRAQNNGVLIDETFRNYNGMHFQCLIIEKAFFPEKYPSIHSPSKLFIEIAKLYESNNLEFTQLLDEAHKQIENVLSYYNSRDLRSSFIDYCKDNYNEKYNSKLIYDNVKFVVDYAKKRNISKEDIEHINSKKLKSVIVQVIESKVFKFNYKDISDFVSKNWKVFYEFLLQTEQNDNNSKNNDVIKDDVLIEAVKDNKNVKNLKDLFLNYSDLYFKNKFNPYLIYEKMEYVVKLANNLNFYGYSITEITPAQFELVVNRVLNSNALENNKLLAQSIEKNWKIFYKFLLFCQTDENVKEISNFNNASVEEIKNTSNVNTNEQDKNNYLDSDKSINHDKDKAFYNWLLKSELSEKSCIMYSQSLNFSSNFGIYKNIVNKRIYEMSNYEFNNFFNTVLLNSEFQELNRKNHNMYSCALKKYLNFLESGFNDSDSSEEKNAISISIVETPIVNELKLSNSLSDSNLDNNPLDKKELSEYGILLNEFFKDGFLFNNPLQKMKFKRLYSESFNKEFTDSDIDYLNSLTNVGFIYDNKIYPFSIIPTNLQQTIKNYIYSNLGLKTNAIYYTNLFEYFQDSLNPLFDPSMLKEYCIKVFNNDFQCLENFITLANKTVDIKQDLINLFLNVDRPLTKDEIYKNMPNISTDVIDNLLSQKDFILNYRGKSYFYKDVFKIEEDELTQIKNFISETIYDQGYISGSELYNYLIKELPEIIDYNPEITELGIRNAIKAYLENDFCFRGDVISDLDNTVNVKTLYSDFCKQYEKFTIDDLKSFRDSIHKNYIDYNVVFEYSVRINEKDFIRKDLINFDIYNIDKALSKYCKNEYTSFCDIVNFNEFPSTYYPWNNYLLESYLFDSSEKYQLIHATFNDEIPVGGIVNRQSKIETLDDLIIQIIKDKKLYDREKAFTYLLENCYILTRKIKNIDILIGKAKQEV